MQATCNEESEQGRESQIKPHNASNMQRGKKVDAENYRKAHDARHKTKTGVWQHAQVLQHVSETIKQGKRRAKQKRRLKTKFGHLYVLDVAMTYVQCWTQDKRASNTDRWQTEAMQSGKHAF